MRFLDFVKNKIAQLKQGVQRYPTPYSYITQKVVQPRVIQPVQKYFQPTQQVRARDIAREIPQAAVKTFNTFMPATTQVLSPRVRYQQSKAAFGQGVKPYLKEMGRQALLPTAAQAEIAPFVLGGAISKAPFLIRAGAGALQGAGFAGAETIAERKSIKELPKKAAMYGAFGAGGEAIAPLIPKAYKGYKQVKLKGQFDKAFDVVSEGIAKTKNKDIIGNLLRSHPYTADMAEFPILKKQLAVMNNKQEVVDLVNKTMQSMKPTAIKIYRPGTSGGFAKNPFVKEKPGEVGGVGGKPKTMTSDIDRIIAAYKQSPSIDLNAVRAEFKNNPAALKKLDIAQAEVKVTRAKNAVIAKREREYGDKLNSLANKTQMMGNDGRLNNGAIRDFQKAEYELAKEYPDISPNPDKIAYYEKTHGVTPPVSGGPGEVGGVVVKPPKTPLKVTETPKQERGLITSAKESELVSPEAKVTLSGNYTPKQNEVLYNSAAKRIAKDEVAAHEFAINTNSDEGTATAIALAQKYRKELNFDKEAYILNEKARRLTEAGREVQAAALIDKLSPEGVVSSAAKLIQKYNETATKKLPEITGTITKEFSDRATQISKLAEGRDRQIAIYQLKRDLNNLIPSSFGDKAITVWKAGLLTSLRTTERNLIGNTLHGAAEVVKDIPSALADRVMALKTGQRTKTFTTQGILSGAKKGAKSAKDIMTLGFDPEASISKYDVKRVNWGQGRIGKALGKYTDFVFNSLGAQDKPFYHSAFARSLYDQAGAAAINASKAGDRAFIEKLVSSPTEDMLKTATQDASIATFKNKNALGKLATNAKRALGNYSAIGEIVAPFTGVPTSIAGQAIAYSPVGLLKGIYNAGKVITSKATAEGIPTLQRQASQEIGRGVIGTGLVGIGVYLANKGLIIGNPKNAQEYAQWQLEGKQPNSILIGGKWRSINSIGPELMVLLAGAQAQHDLKQKNGIGTLAGNIGKTLVSQSSLQGVQQNLNAITNPTQYGQQTIKSTVGSLVPNIISDVGKAFDKTQRETSGYVVEPLKARIPGFRNTLLPSRDVLGNTLPQAPTGVGAFVDLFNSKTPVNNPLVNELSRLNIAGNEATPSKLTANQTIYGQKVKLTPQELDQLESASGGQLQPLLNQIVQEPTYKSLPDEEKKKLIDNAVSDIRTQVKNSLATGEQTFTNSKIGSFNTGNLTDKYKTQMELDTFEKSNKNFQDNGDTVFRKDASGKGIVLSKDKYNSQLYSAQLTSYKKNENLKAWFETADKQLQALDNQLNDPNVDELDKISIQNDIDTLVSNYQKYAGYGGFTKPKKAKKPKKGKVLSVPSVKISALPSAPKVSLKVNKPTVSAKANARAPFRAVVRKPRIATKASFGGKVYKPKMTIRRLYG